MKSPPRIKKLWIIKNENENIIVNNNNKKNIFKNSTIFNDTKKV